MYPYGLIGNCQISALIRDQGSIDWLCLPRPDSPPVFGRILNPKGDTF
jgi:GH15 family glucan-1,4-alpha-glucosidase